jgi:hypothetical protein
MDPSSSFLVHELHLLTSWGIQDTQKGAILSLVKTFATVPMASMRFQKHQCACRGKRAEGQRRRETQGKCDSELIRDERRGRWCHDQTSQKPRTKKLIGPAAVLAQAYDLCSLPELERSSRLPGFITHLTLVGVDHILTYELR